MHSQQRRSEVTPVHSHAGGKLLHIRPSTTMASTAVTSLTVCPARDERKQSVRCGSGASIRPAKERPLEGLVERNGQLIGQPCVWLQMESLEEERVRNRWETDLTQNMMKQSQTVDQSSPFKTQSRNILFINISDIQNENISSVKQKESPQQSVANSHS
jgi:hypothetical protein